ncbi:uncharacterized protein LOC130990432 [Salvia miltiorrhiza]|uniref:uncharacterized protein LOC130990432 n=1 Tax=Salvia miltiorrhiza TaxID=226208 RepID=UPI0025AD6AD7|nr:uncharacterized protein LOC130990432 [Salvia miltiorrhiza]
MAVGLAGRCAGGLVDSSWATEEKFEIDGGGRRSEDLGLERLGAADVLVQPVGAGKAQAEAEKLDEVRPAEGLRVAVGGGEAGAGSAGGGVAGGGGEAAGGTAGRGDAGGGVLTGRRAVTGGVAVGGDLGILEEFAN